MDMGYMYCIFKLLLHKFIKARGCYLRNSYSLTNSFLRMVLLLLLLPSSTWLSAWLYSSYRFLPAGLMVSLLFLLSVLPRNFIRAELYPFIFTEPLFFPGFTELFLSFPWYAELFILVHSTYSPCLWEPNSQNQPKLDYTFFYGITQSGPTTYKRSLWHWRLVQFFSWNMVVQLGIRRPGVVFMVGSIRYFSSCSL